MRSRREIVAYINNVKRRRYRRRLTVSGDPVLTATQSVAYAGFSLVAAGGTEPYRYALIHGDLPDGVAVNADTGAVAGTPTETGSFAATLGVRDTYNKVALLPTFTLVVTA